MSKRLELLVDVGLWVVLLLPIALFVVITGYDMTWGDYVVIAIGLVLGHVIGKFVLGLD